MSQKITGRGNLRIIGDVRTNQIHDLTNEKKVCQIDEIIESGNAVSVPWDSRAEAHLEGFIICYHCLGNQPTM